MGRPDPDTHLNLYQPVQGRAVVVEGWGEGGLWEGGGGLWLWSAVSVRGCRRL